MYRGVLYIALYIGDTVKALKPRAVEALPAGVHRIDTGLYLKRDDGPSGPRRSVLFRWSRDGRPQVMSLGVYSSDRYADFLAQGALYREALRDNKDPPKPRDHATLPAT